MNYIFFVSLLIMVTGLVAVASNPAPYFAALGLVLAAGASCGALVGCGGSFLSLVLFLIYLGGMLVVFAYSAALAAEPFPMSWGDRSIFSYVLFYLVGAGIVALCLGGGWFEGSWAVLDSGGFSVFRGDAGGVAMMYSYGGVMLIVCGWVLLLTLFVVLELTRGFFGGAIRAV